MATMMNPKGVTKRAACFTNLASEQTIPVRNLAVTGLTDLTQSRDRASSDDEDQNPLRYLQTNLPRR